MGVWTFAFDELPTAQVRTDAAVIESLGYPALWVPEGGGSRDVFAHLSLLLSSTERITVCSGIANVTARHAETMREGAATLADAFGERVVLGLGIGHQSTSARRGQDWARPLDRMRTYLDVMDEPSGSASPAVPVRRLLAALGDGMLRLAAERALGAHTYFVPVEHTAHARAQLGPVPVLAVEQTAVLTSDTSHARDVGRGWVADYLELPNYANNWRRLGYEDDLAGGASDRLIDAGIAWGSVGEVVTRVRAHLDAGADHVCVQLIGGAGASIPLLRELAPALERSQKPRDERRPSDPAAPGARRDLSSEHFSSPERATPRPHRSPRCTARWLRLPICRSAQLTAFFTSLRSSMAARRMSGKNRSNRSSGHAFSRTAARAIMEKAQRLTYGSGRRAHARIVRSAAGILPNRSAAKSHTSQEPRSATQRSRSSVVIRTGSATSTARIRASWIPVRQS